MLRNVNFTHTWHAHTHTHTHTYLSIMSQKRHYFNSIKKKHSGNTKKLLGSKTHIQVQEDQKVPNKLNPKRSTPRHIIIKTSKFKERILKTAREKQITTYKETP